MNYYDMDNWNIKKKIIARKDYSIYFKEREVWWCSLGINVGVEENGKGENFTRPVLVLKKFNSQSFLAVPLSSGIKSGKYYLANLIRNQTFLISQVRQLSSQRLISKMFKISLEESIKIKQALIESI